MSNNSEMPYASMCTGVLSMNDTQKMVAVTFSGVNVLIYVLGLLSNVVEIVVLRLRDPRSLIMYCWRVSCGFWCSVDERYTEDGSESAGLGFGGASW